MSASAGPTSRKTQRAPPPSLFIGPPATNSSNVSLPSLRPVETNIASPILATQVARTPLLRNRTARPGDPLQSAGISSPLARNNQPPQPEPRRSRRSGDRTSALWTEMQATLAEVERSASGRTLFFGPEHTAALEELRKAQISLAKAWARSEEADEVVEQPDENGEKENGEKEADQGQDDSERDLLLAKKRREANDRYFTRVNGSVLDVVEKLEGVAVAMEKVERESKEIWSESESLGSASITS
ncbi:hypothetical protein MMC25_008322 [Agyrium rufum]|nr:hypothetical protein [Agyrium rufum]